MTTTMAAKSATTQVYRVYIRATPEAIWDAITKPEFAKRYGYCVPVDIDLRPGGKYRAYANDGMKKYGAPDVIIEGEVIEVDPPRKLVQTWQPVWNPQGPQEPPTRLTFEIKQDQGGTCKLTVIHDLTGAPTVAKTVGGEDETAGGGWAWVLSDLKTLLESGKGLSEK
jgi:uncharacterized protein YndB with AHSA1/START domain